MSAPALYKPDRRPIAWMAGHSVAANLIMLTFLVGGLLFALNIKQEVFPDIASDMVMVSVAYPGSSPEEIEKGILLSIEEAARDLEGIDEITSVAREGSGMVTLELLTGANVQQLAQEIKAGVDGITSFPEDIEEPEVRIMARRREVIEVVIYGDVPDTTLHQLGEQFRDWILQSPDITQVDMFGLPPLEISIEISQDNLRRYGITLADVANKLRDASVDIPGGALKTESGEILIRLTERRDFGEEFAQLPVVTTPDGGVVYLHEIATIDDSFADTDRYSTFNGHH